jgi:hypothetical protein
MELLMVGLLSTSQRIKQVGRMGILVDFGHRPILNRVDHYPKPLAAQHDLRLPIAIEVAKDLRGSGPMETIREPLSRQQMAIHRPTQMREVQTPKHPMPVRAIALPLVQLPLRLLNESRVAS